jgi:hypothetical protein
VQTNTNTKSRPSTKQAGDFLHRPSTIDQEGVILSTIEREMIDESRFPPATMHDDDQNTVIVCSIKHLGTLAHEKHSKDHIV